MNRVLIVGEAPGAGRRDGRTRSRISDLAGREWSEWADWTNLLDEWPGDGGDGGRKGSSWNVRAARESARRLRIDLDRAGRAYDVVVLLGRRVAGAMIPAGAGYPFFRWIERGGDVRMVVIPHTSGVVRWWNEPENVERASEFLRGLAADVETCGAMFADPLGNSCRCTKSRHEGDGHRGDVVVEAIRVRVADGEAEGLDTDGGRWQVICETHGSILSVETRSRAHADARLARLANACEWCDECSGRSENVAERDAGGSAGNGPADDSPKEETMSGKTSSEKKNRAVGPKEAQAREQREANASGNGKPKETQAPKATVDASGLYDALVERAKKEIDGATLTAKKNKQHRYTAVTVGGKNVGYIALGKRSVAVQIRKGKNAGTTKVKAESEFAKALKALSSTAVAVAKEQAEGRETVKV